MGAYQGLVNNEKPYNFVIIARDAWGEVWRRRQFIASVLSGMGHRVLFVERPFSVMRSLAGVSGGDSRPLRRVLSTARTPLKVAQNLFVASPIKLLPDILPGAHRLNLALHAGTIRAALRHAEIKNYILWINPEYGVHLLPYLSPDLVVYDVTDDWTQARLPEREKNEIKENDRLMIKSADVVLAVSQSLYEKKQKQGGKVFLVPNGVAVELYDGVYPMPSDLAALPRPVLGYVGTLHPQRLDVELIEKISRKNDNNFSIALVGPDLLLPSMRERLRRLPRVHLLGAKSYFEVPAYITHFDVCLIPHRIDAFTTSLNPIKVYEYLAAGKPIVSTLLAGVEEFARFIAAVKSPEDFIEAALRLSGEGKPSDADERLGAARANSWKARVGQILKIIETIKPQITQINAD